ncbi:MAG TPA: hypothetical protein VF541_00185 [Longimicrobium sp.]|jgi:hypothetical protein
MSEIDEQEDVPDWVKRMREKGYKITIGTGGPLSYEPEVSFANPPLPEPDLRTRVQRLLRRIGRGVALPFKRLARE